MRRRVFVLSLLLQLASCAFDADDGPSDGVGGKGDDVNPTLAALARAYAEEFDFTAESDTEVAREEAASIGPTWVDRAYALYRSWEESDLGSVRLYKWTIKGYRVWAMRTSTDGDESFIELFDVDGNWLATGAGGFADDPDSESGFRPVINWDSLLGQVRDRVAPKDISEEVKAFWAELEAAKTHGSSSVDLAEARRVVEPFFSGPMTTDALEHWEQGALWRALANRTVPWTSYSRPFAEALQALYRRHFPALGTVTTPSIVTVLGLPSALAARIRLARATLMGAYDDTGVTQFSTLVSKLDRFPSSSVPTTKEHLLEALRRAGCTSAQADGVVARLGADSSSARIAVASLHTISSDWWPVVQPGTGWFIATPSKTFISALTIVDSGETVAGWLSTAESAVADATGVSRTATLVQVRQRQDRTWIDLSYTRPDQGVLETVLELPRSSSEESQIHLRAYSPSLDPELSGNLADAIETGLAVGEVEVLGFTMGEGPYPVVYRASAGPAHLASVDFSTSTPSTTALAPSALSDDQLAELALATARHHAEGMVTGVEPTALVEVLLRTAWATTADLERTTDPDESAVGFDPATEHAQFMLPSVWGDNAVFVTFAKDGTVRVESFN